MSYVVHSIFKTLQGEGANVGRAAIFVRFAGCNLWSGREEDRAGAVCKFCDTDFVGGTRYGAAQLADVVVREWGRPGGFVVFTGGEPTLQLDADLLREVRSRGFEVAVETNGTRIVPGGVDWICVSPKLGAPLLQRWGDEVKVIFPQALDYEALGALPFHHRFVQPMDGPRLAENTAAAVDFCLKNPRWRLSLQAHKIMGIP